MRTVSRRAFFKTSGAALGALPLVRSIDSLAQVTNPVFRHGVASGDPLADRVILWTRVTPNGTATAQKVSWQVARDPKFTQRRRHAARSRPARRVTSPSSSMSRGLEPATTYYYRFQSGGEQSPIGRTKTLPRENVARVRLGVVSCSNLPQGYFNAYACLANRLDLDAILHLGDYLYEYANAQYGDGTKYGRAPVPDKEMVLLEDYRQRHAQYKADPDSQEIHRQHPFIVTWDDHEFTNNTWMNGAENHDHDGQDEGDWNARRQAAMQAYFEWMPIREDAPTLQGRIYRAFRFGNLATLFMLDTRMIGRDRAGATQGDRVDRGSEPPAAWRRAGGLAGRAVRDVRAQQVDVERARAAGDVRAADADRRDRGQRGFLGRLSRRARPRVRHDRAREGRTTSPC